MYSNHRCKRTFFFGFLSLFSLNPFSAIWHEEANVLVTCLLNQMTSWCPMTTWLYDAEFLIKTVTISSRRAPNLSNSKDNKRNNFEQVLERMILTVVFLATFCEMRSRLTSQGAASVGKHEKTPVPGPDLSVSRVVFPESCPGPCPFSWLVPIKELRSVKLTFPHLPT